MGSNIVSGRWLGTFNSLTLAKVPFYPIWLAFASFLPIPLMLSNHLLYIVACLVFIISVRPLFKNRIILGFLYTFLLFNPYSFSDILNLQIMRENIYPALTILVVSLSIGLFIRLRNGEFVSVIWPIAAGLTLSAFWMTREISHG